MKSLFRATTTVGSMTLLSRVLGFVRDMVIAHLFGAGPGADAFFVAFKIPNFMRRLFAEGAFSQAFVPVFAEYKAQRSVDEVRRFAGDVSGTFGSFLLIFTAVGMLATPALVTIFAPGFVDEPEKFALTVEMLRITLPYLFFISMTAYAGGILNAYGKFAVPSFTPVLLNVAMLAAAFGLTPFSENPIVALSWGVFIAGVAQLLFQLPFLHRIGMLTWPRWRWRDSGVQRVMKLMLPAIFGSSVAQINLLLDTLLASFLVTGSVSWLYYSDRLVEFPLGIFGIALATVILPHLSSKHASASKEEFSATLDWALRWVVIGGVPATVGLFILSGPILISLFQYGEFSVHDTKMAALSLMTYSLGLAGFISVKILAPGFYARQDTKTPMRIGIVALGSNMALNLLIVAPMAYFDIVGAHAALAFSTAASAYINGVLLWHRLRKHGVYWAKPGWGKFALQVAAASGIMAMFLVWAAGDWEHWFRWHAWDRCLHLAVWAGLAAGIYFVSLWLLGFRRTHWLALLRHH